MRLTNVHIPTVRWDPYEARVWVTDKELGLIQDALLEFRGSLDQTTEVARLQDDLRDVIQAVDKVMGADA